MVLTIFSLTISITKEEVPREKVIQDEQVKQIFKENQRKVERYTRIRYY